MRLNRQGAVPDGHDMLESNKSPMWPGCRISCLGLVISLNLGGAMCGSGEDMLIIRIENHLPAGPI